MNTPSMVPRDTEAKTRSMSGWFLASRSRAWNFMVAAT